MTLPAGVTTCTVTLGKAVSYLGADASITATLSASKTVVHAATGWSIHSASDPVAATEGTELSFQVPHVNQSGFIDNAGNATTFWTYTLAGAIRFASGQSEPFSRTFQVLVGQSTLDLDLAPDGPTTPGVALPWAPLSMGAITTGAPGSAATATIIGTIPNQVLNLTLPQGNTGPAGPQGTPGTGTVNLPTLVTNLVTNPSFEVDTAGWVAEVNATIARSTADKYQGSQSLLVTHATAGTAVSAVLNVTGLTVGQTYVLSAWVKRAAGTQGAAITIGSTATITDPAGKYAAAPTTWTRVWEKFTATGTSVNIYAYNASAATVAATGTGSAFYLDAVMVTATPTPVDYFDGATAGCWWTGTANASTSVRGLPDNATLVKSYDHPELARNLFPCPAPTPADWVAYWAASSWTHTTDTTDTLFGRPSLKATATATPQTYLWGYDTNGPRMVETGKAYTFSYWVKTSVARQFRGVTVGTATVTAVSQPWVPVPANVWTQVVSAYTVTTDGTVAFCPNMEVVATAGDVIRFAGFTLTEGVTSPPAYFDGDTPGCRWVGTRGASASVKMLPARAETLIDAPELARNLQQDPTFRQGILASAWTIGAGGASVAGGGTIQGLPAAKLTRTGGGLIVVAGTKVPVVPGDVVSGAITAALDGTVGDVTFHLEFNDAAGALVAYSGQAQNATNNSTARLAVRGAVTPAGATTARLRFHVDSGGDGVAQVNQTVLVKGASLPPFFDGDTPGAKWAGTPYASASVKVLASPADEALLTWLDAGRAQGVGSPEGAVTAPVGTRYVDTVATTGAIEWIKATGAGNTGWQVAYGDTGWRNVANLLNVTNFTAQTGMANPVKIRRVGNRVTFAWSLASGTFPAGTPVNVFTTASLAGFGPAPNNYAEEDMPIFNGAGGLMGSTLFVRYPNIQAFSAGGVSGAAGGARGKYEWITADPWPTTLPGTAG